MDRGAVDDESTDRIAAHAQVALAFAGLRNVDLFSQGFYHIRASLHSLNLDAAGDYLRATPLATSDAHPDAPMPTPLAADANEASVLPGHLLDTSRECATPTFRIRYIDQEVRLSYLARFELELPHAEGDGTLEFAPITLMIKLMFAHSRTTFAPELEPSQHSHLFREVAVQRLELRLPLRQGTAFFPLTFDELHFCYAPLTVHAMVVDYLPSSERRPPEQPTATTDGGLRGKSPQDAAKPKVRAAAAAAAAAWSGRGPAALSRWLSSAIPPGCDGAPLPTEAREAALAQLTSRICHLVGSHVMLSERMRALAQLELPMLPSPMPEGVSCVAPDDAAAVGAEERVASTVAQLSVNVGDALDGQEAAHSEARARALAALRSLSERLRESWEVFLDVVHIRVDELVVENSRAFSALLAKRYETSSFRETYPLERRAHATLLKGVVDKLRKFQAPDALAAPPLSDATNRSAERCVFVEQLYEKKLDAIGIPDIAVAVDTAKLPGAGASTASQARRDGGVGGDGGTARPGLSLSWMGEMPASDSFEIGGNGGKDAGSVHLYVFVHGYQGNMYDLRLMRNQMALLLPDKESTRFLMSSWNEEYTNSASFETLGANLAKEVREYLQSELRVSLERNSVSRWLGRVTFICHSFGAIICRSALRQPDLEPLLPKLHAFVSFSGPHLGLLYSSNTLVEVGIWGLRRLKKARCLTELVLKDAVEPTQSLLFKLSCDDKLRHFKHVLLVSSADDRYVPHHSARLTLCTEAMHVQRFGAVYVNMMHNLLNGLECASLRRVEVAFDGEPSTTLAQHLDHAIGRKAHIEFIDNVSFLRRFVLTYLDVFVD